MTVFALPASDKNRATPGTASGLDVGQAIAHQVGIGKNDPQIASRLRQHPNSGFSAVASLAQGLHHCIRVVQAVIGRINTRSCQRKRCFQLAVEPAQRGFVEVSLGDTWLVRDHHYRQAQAVEQTDRFRNVGKQFKLLQREGRVYNPGIAVIDETVDNAVTVEKNSAWS